MNRQRWDGLHDAWLSIRPSKDWDGAKDTLLNIVVHERDDVQYGVTLKAEEVHEIATALIADEGCHIPERGRYGGRRGFRVSVYEGGAHMAVFGSEPHGMLHAAVRLSFAQAREIAQVCFDALLHDM